MSRLLRTELARFRSRPAIAALLLVAVLAGVGVALLTAWDTRPHTREEISTAVAQAAIDGGRVDIKNDVAKCLQDPASYLGPGNTTQDCEDSLTAAARSYLPRDPLSLRGTLNGNGIGLALLVAGLLIIAASIFIGSDFGSGAIANQVLFAPSRTRLWGAKALAVGLWSFAVSTVVLGGFWLSTYLVAADRGLPHGSAILSDVVWHLVRAVVFCTGAAVGTYALTSVFRNATATLGVLFAYAVGGELVLALLPVDSLERWTLGTNVFGWLKTRLVIFDNHCGLGGNCGPQHVTHLESGLYLLALLVIAAGAGLLVFRRRDL